MSCFMGYNPLVAKEVKITTWIKEFDGDSPVYPSFPNDGDCFVVFATDEDALTHNALSKKTYTNGDWADADSGGGGGDLPMATMTIVNNDGAFAEIQYITIMEPPMPFITGEYMGMDIQGEENGEYEFVIYEGQAVITTSEIAEGYTATVTGDATLYGEDIIVATGDFTVTIAQA